MKNERIFLGEYIAENSNSIFRKKVLAKSKTEASEMIKMLESNFTIHILNIKEENNN